MEFRRCELEAWLDYEFHHAEIFSLIADNDANKKGTKIDLLALKQLGHKAIDQGILKIILSNVELIAPKNNESKLYAFENLSFLNNFSCQEVLRGSKDRFYEHYAVLLAKRAHDVKENEKVDIDLIFGAVYYDSGLSLDVICSILEKHFNFKEFCNYDVNLKYTGIYRIWSIKNGLAEPEYLIKAEREGNKIEKYICKLNDGGDFYFSETYEGKTIAQAKEETAKNIYKSKREENSLHSPVLDLLANNKDLSNFDKVELLYDNGLIGKPTYIIEDRPEYGSDVISIEVNVKDCDEFFDDVTRDDLDEALDEAAIEILDYYTSKVSLFVKKFGI